MKKKTINTYTYSELNDNARRKALYVAWVDAKFQRGNEFNTKILKHISDIFTDKGFLGTIRQNNEQESPKLRLEFSVDDKKRLELFEQKKNSRIRPNLWTRLLEELIKMPNNTTIFFFVRLRKDGTVEDIYIDGSMEEEWFDGEDTLSAAKEIFTNIINAILYGIYKITSSEEYFLAVCKKNAIVFTEHGWPLQDLETAELPDFEKDKNKEQ